MSSQERGGCLRLGCGLVFVIAVVAAVYAGMLFISAQSIKADVADATKEAETFSLAIKAFDMEKASLASTRMQNYLHSASDRMNNWEWTIASYIPILNQDVGIIREEVSIACDMTDNALVPLTTSVKDVMTSNDLVEMISQFTSDEGVVASAVKAREVVDACVERSNAVGTSHFSQVNQGVSDFNAALSEVDEILDLLVGSPQELVETLSSLGSESTDAAA